MAFAIGVAVAVVAMASVWGCSGDDFDREGAIQRVVDEADGRITRDQAGCYVDRVRDEIGTGPLGEGEAVAPDQAQRLAAVRVDCIGVANVGAEPPTEPAPSSTVEVAGPRRKGDDLALDALWDECAAGFGQSCDELFDQALAGSAYEDFAVTCGRRTREAPCAAVYPQPGVTLPSPAQPTTTPPPPSP